ncbi:hypothetical protein Tco_0411260 [Tanacetum coccineum]
MIEVLQYQLPPKELNTGNFTLLFTIGNFNFYGMADLGASVNVMPRNIFEYLRLANLRNTNMLVEMADITKKAPLDQHTPRVHFCKPSKQTVDEKTKTWPTYDPTKSRCDGRGDKIYEVSGVGNLRFWYCKRKNITGIGLSFPDYLLAKYGKYQNNSLVWGDRYAEWCNVSPAPGTSSQEFNNLRPRDYTFREWTLIKVGHTDISEPVKKALLKLWLIDCFQDESRIIKNPLSRSFYDYKWAFDLAINQLADEYELRIGKKGHMLDKIWEYCKDVHKNNTYRWHDHGFEDEERDEIGIEIEKYDPPDV